MVVYTIDDLRNEIESLSETGRTLTQLELERAFKITVAVQHANEMKLKTQIQKNHDLLGELQELSEAVHALKNDKAF